MIAINGNTRSAIATTISASNGNSISGPAMANSSTKISKIRADNQIQTIFLRADMALPRITGFFENNSTEIGIKIVQSPQNIQVEAWHATERIGCDKSISSSRWESGRAKSGEVGYSENDPGDADNAAERLSFTFGEMLLDEMLFDEIPDSISDSISAAIGSGANTSKYFCAHNFVVECSLTANCRQRAIASSCCPLPRYSFTSNICPWW